MLLKKLFVLVSLLTIYNAYFFPAHIPSPGRVDFLTIIVLVLSSLWFLAWPKNWETKEKISLGSSIIAIITAYLALHHASRIDQFLLGGVSVTASMVSMYTLLLDSKHFGGLFDLAKVPVEVALTTFGQLIGYYLLSKNTTKSVFFENLKNRLKNLVPSGEKNGKIIRGLAITIPIASVIQLVIRFTINLKELPSFAISIHITTSIFS